jgi:sugar lactone lactonase YvrE
MLRHIFLKGAFIVSCLLVTTGVPVSAASAVRPGHIATAAGFYSFNGDGRPADTATLNSPFSVFVDSTGNLWVADSFNQRIRRVDAVTSIITTIAGDGNIGYNGDNRLAVSAHFSEPYGVTVDWHGNSYVADRDNNRIRRIDARSGLITTVAGTGAPGYNGDGISATHAELNTPYGVEVDHGGNLYIADTFNERVRRVDAATGIITTVAGTGTTGFNGDGIPATQAELNKPRNATFDNFGNLCIPERNGNRVRLIDSQTGIIKTVAGTGRTGYNGDGIKARVATLSGPRDCGYDADNNLYIADTGNSRVRRVDNRTGIITTLAGNGTHGFGGDGGPATSAALFYPRSVALKGNTIYIADAGNDRVRAVSLSTGTITTYAGVEARLFNGDSQPATTASVNRPEGVAVDKAGNVFVADTLNSRVRRIDANTGIITTVAGNGSAGYNGDSIPALAAELKQPSSLAVDLKGDIFIADRANNRVRRVDANTGLITTVAGTGHAGARGDGGAAVLALLNYPDGVALDPHGDLFFSDRYNNRVRQVSAATGIITTVAGTGAPGYSGDGSAAAGAELNAPVQVAVAHTTLYIADTMNQRIRAVNLIDGIITTVAGTGTSGYNGDGLPATSSDLSYPRGIAVDPSGNLFIGDTGQLGCRTGKFAVPAASTGCHGSITPVYGSRLRMVNATDGIMHVVGGMSTHGYDGDGQAAVNAMLYGPRNVAVAGGNVYFADTLNNRLRLVYGIAATGTIG